MYFRCIMSELFATVSIKDHFQEPAYTGAFQFFLYIANHVIIITIPPMLVKLSVRIENVMDI